MFKDTEVAWGAALSMGRYGVLVAGNSAWFSMTWQAEISSEWKREEAIVFLLQTETLLTVQSTMERYCL